MDHIPARPLRSRSPRPSRAFVLAASSAMAIAALASCGGNDDVGGDGGSANGPVDGAAVYARSCASCHGDDLRGTDRGPSHLSMVYEPGHHTDASFRVAITDGAQAHHWTFGPMPPVVGLSDDEIDAVIAFIREQQEEHGFELYPPPP